ncbi:MAG: FRG domain-containing protein [Rhodothermaceae bacterium]|nr:FRG domain-containing protein [Rhodothermaceae bacterium]MYG69882.1 FRG domain-containing protein [Rhodothermaceae bacterium]
MYEKTQKKIRKILNECKDERCIFRGENRDYKVPASSKLYREHNTVASPPNDRMLESEKTTVDAARHHVRADASDLEVLTELQHYGGKTALIDFTRNLSIALFFACEGYPDQSGRIILFDTTGLEEKERIEAGKISGESGYEIVHPAGKNLRAVSQSSVFVRATKGYIDGERFKDIGIEKELKKEILSYLERYQNIDRHTIYNDLHGFIENQRDSYSQQAYYDSKVRRAGTAELYYARGTARLASGRLMEAIEDFDEAIRLDPEHPRALHQRGLIKVSLKDKSGIDDYRHALEIRHDPLTLDNLLLAENFGEDYWGR